jgi:hypothetical protein
MIDKWQWERNLSIPEVYYIKKQTMSILWNKAVTILIFLFIGSAKQINMRYDKCALISSTVPKIYLPLKAGSV